MTSNVSKRQPLAAAGIACVGAGPANLYFAILAKLEAPDRPVTLFERQRQGVSLGWGVVFPEELIEALEATDPVTGAAVRRQAFRWDNLIVDVAGKKPVSAPQHYGYSMGRRALLDILEMRARELGVTLHFEHEIRDRAQLADAELVLAGDGVNSVLRDAQRGLHGSAIERGRNKYIWLGTSKQFNSFSFPFVHTQAGWLWAHAYGYAPSASTFIVETSAETWTALGFDKLDADTTMRRLEALFAPWLEGHALQHQTAASSLAPWLEFHRVTNTCWHNQRLALIGDAAHTTHFTIGSGTRLALADAIALAAQLRSHTNLESALTAYEQQRMAELQDAQLEARFSAQWFEQLPRYIDRDVEQFAALLDARRSSLLPYLPPNLFLQLRKASQWLPFVSQPVLRLARSLQRQ